MDSYILTDEKIPHNCPDNIMHNKNTKEFIILDVAIPLCQNIVKKEAERINKHCDIEIEIQKCWNVKNSE